MITIGTTAGLFVPATAISSVKVIGVGNAGLAILNCLAEEEGSPADLVAMHTNAEAVAHSLASEKLQLGLTIAKGLGSGGDPSRGRASASENIRDIRSSCLGAKFIMVCGGLGGGTGSGGLPILAEQAKKAGALVLGVVTMPFAAEGSKCREQAEQALVRLRRYCVAVLCFENDRIVEICSAEAPLAKALAEASSVLSLAVRSITQMISLPPVLPVGLDELVNMFHDAEARCDFGYGVASGPNRANLAVEEALRSPLLEQGRLLAEPKSILLHLTGDASFSLAEMKSVLACLSPHVGASTQILLGVATDSDASGRIGVTILAATSMDKSAAVLETEGFAMLEGETGAGLGENRQGEAVNLDSDQARRSAQTESDQSTTGQTQEELPLDQAVRGRFKDLDPTMVDGQDLDIPTFLRQQIKLH